MLESRFPDESRDSSPAAGLVILHLPQTRRRAESLDREDERVSASLFSQPWQSGVKVVSD